MPFEGPDRLNNVGPEQKNQRMWVDIYVPNPRPPGRYTMPIAVSSDQGQERLTV
jgi:hypothetical protein